MEFSEKEIRDIVISVLALAFAFALLQASLSQVLTNPIFIITSILTVGIAFIGHELAHKFVARARGYWAEYKMWPQGLVLAVLLAAFGGIVFAAPGAVYFTANRFASRRDIGLIGIAGIVFNLILFGILFPAYLFTGLSILRFAAMINVWLAIFNLIPFPPLDGSKVFAWDRKIWASSLGVAVIGFILTFS